MIVFFSFLISIHETTYTYCVVLTQQLHRVPTYMQNSTDDAPATKCDPPGNLRHV